MPGTVRAAPRAGLTPTDVTIMVVGIVLGIGIFKTPSLVAQYSSDETVFVLLWLLGGLITVIGSVCYAELGSARPDSGGEYAFLREAYGPRVALLFAWARCAVIQPGAIAGAAFVTGDYANVVWPLGTYGPGLYALASVTVFTLVNYVGTTPGKLTQKVVEVITVLSMLGIFIAAFVATVPAPHEGTPHDLSLGSTGLAMMFILLTYGGWNEAAYLSGELEDARRTMARALVMGVVVVIGVSLAINSAYLHVLGLDGIRDSNAVGSAMMRVIVGDTGATITGVVVVLSTLTTLNGLIITGSRSYYALGRDVAALRSIGTWKEHGSTPANALVLQGAVSAALVVFGAATRVGFQSMVAYTSPVFWFFMLLVSLSVYIFRRRETGGESHYRVPLYPVTPALFALSCLWVLWSSLFYAGWGAIIGVAVLLVGTPLLFLDPARV
ncbi:APC family permease [Streptomyces sp. KS 21]|uniref:APC family permease n=1 Tax=Streptomyces sp. KS 21 TaxID=2485150 RepID=UPI00106360B9|nr:APC family permease [Streptomyces sp. KS 21]TDU80234.1 amino acid/polyamine/organocation transporter (APC superfamily) [Streptomyces sp. KS 21]